MRVGRQRNSVPLRGMLFLSRYYSWYPMTFAYLIILQIYFDIFVQIFYISSENSIRISYQAKTEETKQTHTCACMRNAKKTRFASSSLEILEIWEVETEEGVG